MSKFRTGLNIWMEVDKIQDEKVKDCPKFDSIPAKTEYLSKENFRIFLYNEFNWSKKDIDDVCLEMEK